MLLLRKLDQHCLPLRAVQPGKPSSIEMKQLVWEVRRQGQRWGRSMGCHLRNPIPSSSNDLSGLK